MVASVCITKTIPNFFENKYIRIMSKYSSSKDIWDGQMYWHQDIMGYLIEEQIKKIPHLNT